MPGTTGEAISRANEVQRKRVKAAIIFRKNFSPPAESSVLTWQAKEQLIYLSSLSPDEWSAETISKNFPISDSGASKFFLKSQKQPNRVFRSLESVIHHDTACIGRWIDIIRVIVELQLEMGYIRPTLSTVLNALSHKLPRDLRWVGLHNVVDLLSFADGNYNLPLPPETSLDVYQRKLSQHSPGPFQKIAENIQKPLLPHNNVVLMRGQQLDVIRIIMGLFRDQNFSPFVESLRKDPPLLSHNFYASPGTHERAAFGTARKDREVSLLQLKTLNRLGRTDFISKCLHEASFHLLQYA
ncbi:unnamed protein product [Dibothriocephalus latus]|uniref:Uncharacterized protein n=1 Tax=Dibothriocephalus latus TaxID=60516 RepID=A0A3P7NMS1_DIBLA|nr:unnamed protein product [Dibothriocephalus latus]